MTSRRGATSRERRRMHEVALPISMRSTARTRQSYGRSSKRQTADVLPVRSTAPRMGIRR